MSASLLSTFSTHKTYIVLRQVRVVCLDAIVQYGHNNTLARVALLPGRTHIHVQAILGATVLFLASCDYK